MKQFEFTYAILKIIYSCFRFTPQQLKESLQQEGYELEVVIDLTFTFRYYSGANVSEHVYI